MTTRYRRNTRQAPKSFNLPRTRDEQKVERLPFFGPGLRVRIPLHLWPAYQKVHQLEVLDPQLPAHERITQTVLYVRRVPGAPQAPVQPEVHQDTWQCLACDGQPEFLHRAMMQHIREVHQIDTASAVGTKNLIMAADGAGFYYHTWEYVIDGLKFLRFAHREKRST